MFVVVADMHVGVRNAVHDEDDVKAELYGM